MVREGISFRDKVAAAMELDLEKDLAEENDGILMKVKWLSL